MSVINFITDNPATTAFQKAQKDAREQDLNDVRVGLLGNQLDELNATRDSRLRQINAGADLAETHAQTAKDEAPYAGPTKAANLRQANAHATNTEMGIFSKALDVAETHGVDASKEFSRRAGMPEVSEDILNNAEFRKRAAEVDKQLAIDYANRPKDRKTAMQSFIDEYRRTHPNLSSSVTAPYQIPNAPTPQETTGAHNFEIVNRSETDENGKPVVRSYSFDKRTKEMTPLEGQGGFTRATGVGAGATGQTRQIIADLQKEDPNLTYAEALSLAKRAPNGDMIALRKEALALNAAKAEGGGIAKPESIEKWRLKHSLPPAPPEPAPPPAQPGFFSRMFGNGSQAPVTAPAAQRPEQMTPGDGGRPLNIQLPPMPPGVPAGSSYSPSRRMWRSGDGQVFDENGQPVQQ